MLGTSAVGDNAEPTWIPGITGSALHFDGTNDYALVADASELRFTGSFTIEAWVRRNQLGIAQAIVAKDEGSSKRNYLALILSTGLIEFSWRDTNSGSTRKATSAAGITDMNWHHVACIYDADAAASRIFLDGVQTASSSTSGTPYTGPEAVRFGARGASSGGGISDPLRGDIDLGRISSDVRYTASFTPPNLLHGAPKKLVVKLDWSLPVTGLPKNYKIYRQELPSGPNTLIGTIPFSLTPERIDPSVESEHSYRYTVAATNANDVQGPVSSPVDITIPVPTDAGADGVTAVRVPRLQLEPNPFNPRRWWISSSPPPGQSTWRSTTPAAGASAAPFRRSSGRTAPGGPCCARAVRRSRAASTSCACGPTGVRRTLKAVLVRRPTPRSARALAGRAAARLRFGA